MDGTRRVCKHDERAGSAEAVRASENVEEYLEALWASEEKGRHPARVSWLAERLRVTPPSVVEMFKKLEQRGLVRYYPYRGIELLDEGRTIAGRVMRNHRLLELLMKRSLGLRL